MERVLLWLGTIALLAGCQSQNPFAAFGPPTVPAPTTSPTAPYYPPTATGPQRATPKSAGPSTRMSVSAEGTSPAPRSSFAADPADRDPIRVVENSAAQTRTASTGNRSPTPGPSPPQAPGAPAAPTKTSTGGKPSATPQSSYWPRSPAPAAAAPTFRTDSAVVPAGYQQSAPAFSETPMANGQWRAR
jgi:hypothetical protein